MSTNPIAEPPKPKLIHIAKIFGDNGWQFVFLKQLSQHMFQWFYTGENFFESPADVSADSVQEAMRLGFRHWKDRFFKPLGCGFRYNLPERDEHGINALFHQMVASLSSFNGVYFDEELGHLCFVQNASIEARQLWQQLSKSGKL
ncbi:MAG: hypothetical protein WC222_04725 [Parachlamydiales bacterium]|jgi:hypothetical protein